MVQRVGSCVVYIHWILSALTARWLLCTVMLCASFVATSLMYVHIVISSAAVGSCLVTVTVRLILPSCIGGVSWQALRGKGDLGFRGVGKRVGDQRAGERRQSGAGQWGVVRDNANRLAPTSRHYSDIFMPPLRRSCGSSSLHVFVQ